MRVWDSLAGLTAPTDVHEAPGIAGVRLLVEALARRGRAGVFVAVDERSAQTALAAARFFRPDVDAFLLPAWDTLPYDRVSPSAAVAATRCSVLSRLARPGKVPRLVTLSAACLIQRTAPLAHMATASLVARQGADASREDMVAYLANNGYVRAANVREPGEFAVRGGILDIFPPGFLEPVRLDFFGDTVEAIKHFDPETQRSTIPLPELLLAPVSEVDFSDAALDRLRRNFVVEFGPPGGDPTYEAARARIRRPGVEQLLPLFYDQLDTVLDYGGERPLIGLEPGAIDAAADRFAMAMEAFSARQGHQAGPNPQRTLAPDRLLVTGEELMARLASAATVNFSAREAPARRDGLIGRARAARTFGAERVDPGRNLFEEVARYLRDRAAAGKRVVVAAWSTGSGSRLIEFLTDHGVERVRAISSAADIGPGEVGVAELPIETGFEDDDLCLIAEQDILGDKLARPRRRKSAAAVIAEATALNAGDLVVHIDHGVGRYEGLRTVEVDGAAHDCLELLYAGGDKILLPVENVELISRYGAETGESALDRLGGAGWQTRKARARKKIMEMADDLIRLAADRALKRAPHTDPADGVFREFCARFPYEETEDQLSAIEDVIGDLASTKPMDRLICGDVGFGKTEVALRAAFLAAMSGLQVAVIAPTTLLARQHFATFSERFAGWPVKVRHLSRFVTAAEASRTREEISSGECDVVIGTHALLAKSIHFKRLGLLVIDEEQRFGVKHKERLKELKSDIHVLTLSATPIPRTLQMAMAGIRDLSIIATPPVDRLAVRTYVVEFDPVTVREALLREKFRGGQIYYVAPRIADIPFIERYLRDQVPEVRFVVAHGQMAATDLEDAMSAFYEGRYDVLLSTTIVESGLDIPRANTMIIHRADMFGLAQLYQLRGRVGRAKVRAYAYLTTPEENAITPGADRRLKVLQSLDSLGAGFMLASHDLDMRGGGNLLGEEQSGHIREVGVELYQQMLEDAVTAIRAGGLAPPSDDWSPQIETGAAVLIPEGYVADLATRLSLYRRLADVTTDEDRDAFAAEMVDRFGPLPDETRQLLDITGVKILCKRLGVAKVSAGPKGAVFAFRADAKVDGARLIAFVHRQPNAFKLRPDAKLVATGAWPDAPQRLRAVRKILQELTQALQPA